MIKSLLTSQINIYKQYLDKNLEAEAKFQTSFSLKDLVDNKDQSFLDQLLKEDEGIKFEVKGYFGGAFIKTI